MSDELYKGKRLSTHTRSTEGVVAARNMWGGGSKKGEKSMLEERSHLATPK